MYCCYVRLHRNLKILLAAGAKINDKNQKGQTPLCLAIQYKHTNVLRYLIEQGADILDLIRYCNASKEIIDCITQHLKQEQDILQNSRRSKSKFLKSYDGKMYRSRDIQKITSFNKWNNIWI